LAAIARMLTYETAQSRIRHTCVLRSVAVGRPAAAVSSCLLTGIVFAKSRAPTSL